jgi:hypothetical protein
MDAWLHSRLKGGHRTPGFAEPLSDIDLELRDLLLRRCHPGQDITGQQTQSELVGVIENDRVVDGKVER